MPMSVEVLGGAYSVLFRGALLSMWGTTVGKPVVAIMKVEAIVTGLLVAI